MFSRGCAKRAGHRAALVRSALGPVSLNPLDRTLASYYEAVCAATCRVYTHAWSCIYGYVSCIHACMVLCPRLRVVYTRVRGPVSTAFTPPRRSDKRPIHSSTQINGEHHCCRTIGPLPSSASRLILHRSLFHRRRSYLPCCAPHQASH